MPWVFGLAEGHPYSMPTCSSIFHRLGKGGSTYVCPATVYIVVAKNSRSRTFATDLCGLVGGGSKEVVRVWSSRVLGGRTAVSP